MSKASLKHRHRPMLETLETRLNPAPQIVLDNGPWITNAGNGFGGADTSELYLPHNIFGFGARDDVNLSLADNFTSPGPNGLYVYGFIFLGYQTNQPPAVSPISNCYLTLWNGPPNAGGAVILPKSADLLTDPAYTFGSGVYRVQIETPLNNARYVNYAYCDSTSWLTSLYLPPGNYWLEFSFTYSNGAGNVTGFVPPTVPAAATDNGLQRQTAAWVPLQNPAAGAPADIPFYIYGDFPAGPTGGENPGSFILDGLAEQPQGGGQVIETSTTEQADVPTPAVEQVFAETVEQPAIAPTPSAASEVFQASSFQLDFAL